MAVPRSVSTSCASPAVSTASRMGDIPYGRLLRELQLGQQLYQGGELYDLGAGDRSELLNDALNAKWTDPILGCMAYYALADEARRSADPERMLTRRQLVAKNLLRYFPELPDARIIAGLELIPDAPSASESFGTAEMPVLARSLRQAALTDRDRASVARPDNWLLSWLAHRVPAVSRRLNRRVRWSRRRRASTRIHPSTSRSSTCSQPKALRWPGPRKPNQCRHSGLTRNHGRLESLP